MRFGIGAVNGALRWATAGVRGCAARLTVPPCALLAGERCRRLHMIFSSRHRSGRSQLVTAIFAALSAAPAIAQTTTADVTNLDRVEVTAVRHAQTVDDALASVTVIDREQIERSPAVDLIGLLAQQAGVDVARTGGAGQSSTVFLRGANSNQTLVLIDGVRVASTGQGVFDFAHLPLDQIQRIEIVRGPRAAFWGSDAIGGVL
ncbi:MAG: TonB-dependent receptor plug domain-containing protein, partial [Lysobacteraceae bacterium]